MSFYDLNLVCANHEILLWVVKIMAKKVIDIIIDGNTGKITIHVDGYEHEECTELARKLAGSNVLIPTKGELTIPERSGKSKGKEEQELNEKKEVRR